MPRHGGPRTSIGKTGSTQLTGQVTLSQGSGITLTQSGQDISIAAAAGITGPGTTTDTAIAVWNGTTGTALSNTFSTYNSTTGSFTLTKNASNTCFSNPQDGTNCETYGGSARASGVRGTSIGRSATTVGNTDATAIGYNAQGGDTSATAIGASSNAKFRGTAVGHGAVAWQNCVAVGHSAQAGDDGLSNTFALGQGLTVKSSACTAIGNSIVMNGVSDNIVIGNSITNSTYSSCIQIGRTSTVTANNQCLIGGNITWIDDFYLGKGVTHATITDRTLQITGASGTNIAGSNFIIAGSKATGNAAGGALIFKVSTAGASGTTLQSLVEKFRINPTGIGFFAVAPVAQQASTAGAVVAGAAYTAQEQGMLNDVYAAMRAYGLLT
jgi:hypothetical protein